MSNEHVIVRKDGTILSRLDSGPGQAPREVFWQDSTDAALTNYRFAVRYPSADAACRGAEMYEGEARELIA